MRQRNIPIIKVLLFRDPAKARALALPLWAALQEVQHLYNNAQRPRGTFHRFYMGPELPEGIPQGDTLNPISEHDWEQCRGKYAQTYDHAKVAGRVRSLLPPFPGRPRLVIVCDREIIPPAGYRYIIWDDSPAGTVISTTPTDPEYWGDQNPNRVMLLKHRVRTACCSVVGTALRLKRCRNSRCLLREPINSVADLDEMIYIGEEHEQEDLTGRGLAPSCSDPARVQPVEVFAESTLEG